MISLILINLFLFTITNAEVYKLDKYYSGRKVCDRFSNWQLIEDNLYEGYRIKPGSILSCVTTSEFYVSNGVLEVTARIKSNGIEDRVSVLLFELNLVGEYDLVSRIDVLPTPGLVDEVQTKVVNVIGHGRLGYVILLGEASKASTIIIESLQFETNKMLINKATLAANKTKTKVESSSESSMMIFTGAPDRLSTVSLNPPTIPSPTTTPEPTTVVTTDTDTDTTDFGSTTLEYNSESTYNESEISSESTDATTITTDSIFVTDFPSEATAGPSASPELSTLGPGVSSGEIEEPVTDDDIISTTPSSSTILFKRTTLFAVVSLTLFTIVF